MQEDCGVKVGDKKINPTRQRIMEENGGVALICTSRRLKSSMALFSSGSSGIIL